MRVRQGANVKGANVISFKCPGCKDMHSVPVNGAGWGWNGSLDLPTITPSIDVKTGHYAPSWKAGDNCWCDQDYPFKCYRCHSTVTNGRISFCPDSSHASAGTEIDLPTLAE